VIQIWHGDLLGPIRADGVAYVYSPTEYWYLDHLETTWHDMYDVDIPDDALGGEGCMWGETVDPSDLEATVWPRLAAIAEKLWSRRQHRSNDVVDRLRDFRCLLLERDVRAGLVDFDGRDPPPGPASCKAHYFRPTKKVFSW